MSRPERGWCRLLGLPLLLWLALPSHAAIDAYQFDDPVTEQRFHALIGELRCPKCQNQTIADSNAPLSQDLRQKVYEMLQAGQSDQEIVQFLVTRYGDFITYRPPLRPVTWLLWFGPLLGLVLTAGLVALWVRRRNRQAPVPLSEQERARLAALLAEREEPRP